MVNKGVWRMSNVAMIMVGHNVMVNLIIWAKILIKVDDVSKLHGYI